MLCSLLGKENLVLKPVTLPLADAGEGRLRSEGLGAGLEGSGHAYLCLWFCHGRSWKQGWEGPGGLILCCQAGSCSRSCCLRHYWTSARMAECLERADRSVWGHWLVAGNIEFGSWVGWWCRIGFHGLSGPAWALSLLSQEGLRVPLWSLCTAAHWEGTTFMCIVSAMLGQLKINICFQNQSLFTTGRALPHLCLPLKLRHPWNMSACAVCTVLC